MLLLKNLAYPDPAEPKVFRLRFTGGFSRFPKRHHVRTVPISRPYPVSHSFPIPRRKKLN